MKSIIKRAKQEQTVNYPCLKEFKEDQGGYIVLFVRPETGMVVFSQHPKIEVGKYWSDGDMISWAENAFKPFSGTIELSNE